VRAGTALIPRGEFAIVIAGIGVTAGQTEDLSSVTACYVLVLAVAGPIIARYADPIADVILRRRTLRARPA
jgi:CPA2 family monovalent cation:H+ antiporter-2